MLSWSIETYERLTSTQEELKERLARSLGKQDLPEGLVIQAIEQTAGRGRQGRLWLSPPGNLYMTLLLKPQCPISEGGSLSLVVGYSIVRALEKCAGEQLDFILKWPNDVLFKSRKCAGILLESETDEKSRMYHVMVGIGLNLVSCPPDTGIALNECGKLKNIPLSDIRDTILQCLEEDYMQWKSKGFAAYRDKWLERTYPKGTEVSVGFEKKRIKGLFKSIDLNGNLIITNDKGEERTLASGEIVQT